MTQVISFEDYTPVPRYDGEPWTQVRVEEGSTVSGPWTLIDTIALSPIDTDPTKPATRSFTTENASDLPDLWYQLIFTDGTGNVFQPTFPIQNGVTRAPYATVNELARVLRLRQPTDAQNTAMQRVLEAAAYEINQEIGTAAPLASPLAAALVVEVNLERAVEHWQQQESPFGIVGLEGGVPTVTARDTWDRHASKLASLKSEWGVA